MEISVLSDAISTIVSSTQGFAFSNLLLTPAQYVFSVSDKLSDQMPSSSSASVRISAAAPPPTKTLSKPRLRKSRRVKRRSLNGDGDNGGSDLLFFLSDGGGFNNGDGYFGSGGGGRDWNFGGGNWDESPDNSVSDPAFDFVYEILCWIAMSNCLHFAFKKVVRIVADGLGDQAREKVIPIRFTPVC